MLYIKFKPNYKKLGILLLTLFFVFFSLSSNAINENNKRVSLNLTSTPLEVTLHKIELQSNFNFTYNNNAINLKRLINIKVKNESIDLVLEKLFKNTGVIYKIINNKVILKRNLIPIKNKYKITGIIVDEANKDPIPFCSITVGNSYSGTSSNELGEFEISLDSLPTKLLFSHISYQKQILPVSKESEIIVKLTPLTNILEEIQIKTVKKESDPKAILLAKKALDKASRAIYKKKYGKAFYRQKSKNGSVYSELSEIIYDIEYNSSGIQNWDIIEGRYAIKRNSINNKNYTLLSRILKVIQPEYTDDLIFPLNKKLEEYYNVQINNTIKSEKGNIAILSFRPIINNKPILGGKVYINTSTFDILKVTGNISKDNLDIIRLSEKGTSKKNFFLSYEISFKNDSILNTVIDYIKVDQEFDYYKKDSLHTHISTTSNLTFFEYYTPNNRKKLGGGLRYIKSDWEKLNQIGYSKKFWEDNSIIKRTPVEDEVIESFEKNNAFESIFINSREQISLKKEQIFRDPKFEKMNNNLENYNHNNPIERVFLHTDKNLFSVGEEIWFNAYTVLGPELYFTTGSKVLHVDLINSENKIELTQTLELIKGKANNSIEIPIDLKPGNYKIRAYTNWMRNYNHNFFFVKNIRVVNKFIKTTEVTAKSGKIDLQFFPESGYAINGLNNRIAFKAIEKNGLEKEVKGTILDSQGNFVAPLISSYKGSGTFNLTPKLGEKYIAKLNDNSEYPLPEILNSGYTMFVNNINSKIIKVGVQATKDLINKKFNIVGHIRNQKYYQSTFNFKESNYVSFEIPKSRFPSGVMTLTLFSEEMEPQAERIIFIDNKEELVINAKINPQSFTPKSKVKVDINITDASGLPVSTNFSIAITDSQIVQKDSNQSNILTYLLMESDLKGHIEDPAFFFKNNNRLSKFKLDLVMLTNGWRRFNWQEIKDRKKDSLKKYPFIKGQKISGIIKGLDNKNLKENTKLKVTTFSKNEYGTYFTTIKKNGYFSFDKLIYTGNTKLLFNAYSKEGTEIPVKATLNLPKENNISQSPIPTLMFVNKTSPSEKEYMTNVSSSKYIDSLYYLNLDTKSTVLNEFSIKVKTNKKKDENETPSLYGIDPDATVYTKNNIGKNLYGLLQGIAGVKVGKGYDKDSVIISQVFIRGSDNPPLWVIDGASIPTFSLEDSFLSVTDIERVEILKGTKAAIFGVSPNTTDGAILIYTKQPKRMKYKSQKFDLTGYSEIKEFYSPKYSNNNDNNKEDLRSTLYWSPDVKTDKNGDASLIFYNSDITKEIQISIETLSNSGIPGTYLKTFNNNK